MLQPGEKMLIYTGMPGKKAQGEPPTREGLRTYPLLQREVLLKGNGTIIRFVLNQIDVAKVTFDKEATNGIARGEVTGDSLRTAGAGGQPPREREAAGSRQAREPRAAERLRLAQTSMISGFFLDQDLVDLGDRASVASWTFLRPPSPRPR